MRFSFTFTYNTRAVNIEGKADVHGQDRMEDAENLLRHILGGEGPTLEITPRDDSEPA